MFIEKSMKIKNALLIVPPFCTLYNDFHDAPLLGVSSLSAVLSKEGYNVYVLNTDNKKHSLEVTKHSPYKKNIIDEESEKTYLNLINNLNASLWQRIKKEVEYYSPDIVGITTLTSTYHSSINIAKIVKSIDKRIIVVLGGIHPTSVPQQVLNNEEVDFVVRGEGEYTFLNLIKSLSYDISLEKVKGISYKKDGKIIHNEPANLIDNLDLLPFPLKEVDIDISTYSSNSLGEIMTARGCPYSCIYCASHLVWGKRVRFRSIENVLSEIVYTKRRFGTEYFVFSDDSFNINRNRVITFCENIKKRKLNIRWWCEIRAYPFDEEMLRKMKESGCVSIALGIETGNKVTMERIKKGITLEQVKRCVELIKKYDIELNTFFMIGFPWETKEQIRDTVNFMKKVSPTGVVNLSVVTPYPGTELYKILVEEKMIEESFNWLGFMHHRRTNFFNKYFSDSEFLHVFEKAIFGS